MIKKLIKTYWLILLGIAVGAIGGYLYWLLVGCESGTCSITSSPTNSTIWGAVMGGLILDLFRKQEPKG